MNRSAYLIQPFAHIYASTFFIYLNLISDVYVKNLWERFGAKVPRAIDKGMQERLRLREVPEFE